MGRQWRIEFEGAYYHVLSRGNDGKPIFSIDTDRTGFIGLLGDLSERFENELAVEIARITGSDINYLKETEKIPSPRRLAQPDTICFMANRIV